MFEHLKNKKISFANFLLNFLTFLYLVNSATFFGGKVVSLRKKIFFYLTFTHKVNCLQNIRNPQQVKKL